ncbi:MAG: N-acetylmuramoyl-L-alanine amidase [Muribaculaceae bacterium]|nr:N-acetylmuramoyl-L-alanine amidase [Muribaculaceae bacterium]
MKKILLSALLISSLTIDANAVTYAYDVASNYTGSAATGGPYKLSTPANFKTGNTLISSNYNKSGKWYVNAGHGGFDSDDRPTPMPLLGGEYFYESEGNLDRALHMEQWLIQNGGTVKMSRRENTSAWDLNLTSIATASSSYGGYFISMHSNGANASANYHVALYKGSNATNSIAGSERMARENSINNYNNGCLTEFTYGTPRSMADYDLMGWHYGVLRTNTQPGYLVETWFHDYRPESLRFKSSLYNKFLAWQIAVGNLTAPGGSGSLPGCVVGDVRDKSQGCGYSNYTARGRDLYLAVNNANVTLSGNGINYTVSTGAKGNGVFAFFVPAGTYTLTVAKDGYKTQTHTVTVSNNKATQKDIDFVQGTNSGISLNPTSMGFGQTYVDGTSNKTLTVSGTDLTANISIASSNTTDFKISHTSLGTSGGTITVTYQPKSVGSHNTTLTFTSGTHKTTMVVSGTAVNPPLTFTEGWNYSETSNKKAGWMANWTSYRNMAFGDGKLYVVDVTNNKVKVIKAQTCEHLYDLDMTGVTGGALALVDVAYVDGKLIGTNIALASNDTMKTLKVYIWDNDEATPRVLLETTNLGGMDRIGDTVNFQGTLTSGKICYFAQQTRDYTDADGNTANGNCNSLVTYAVTNGVASTTPVVADVDAFIAGSSPRAVPDGNNFWVLGQHYVASQINANGELIQSIPLTATNIRQASDGCGNDFVPFTFKGTQYAFTTAYNRVTDTDGDGTFTPAEVNAQTLLGGRAVLIDGSEGWAVEGLTGSGNYPSAGLSSKTRNTSYSTSICVNVNGTSGVEMWVLVHNQGIAYYKHGTAPTYTYENIPSISVSTAALEMTTTEGNSTTADITVTGAYLEGDITAALSGTNADLFSISTSKVAQSGGNANGKITVTYAPTAKGDHTATLTLTSANASTVKVTLKGSCKPNYTFDDQNIVLTEGWNFSTNGTQPSYIDLTTNVVRAAAYQDGKLYVLQNKAWATPVVTIVDAYTGAQEGTLDMTGIGSATIQLSDILAVDGKIIGCACVTATQTLRIYQWDSDTSAPKVLLEQVTGKIMGGSMSISGNLTNGRLWFTNDGTTEAYYYTISNGAVNSTLNTISLMKADGTTAWVAGDGRGSAEVILNSDGTLWIDAKDAVPTLFTVSGTTATLSKSMASVVNKFGTALKFFTFGDRKLAAATTYTSTTALTGGQLALLDVSAGIGSETAIETRPASGLGETGNAQRVSTVCVATDRNDGMSLDLWVAVNGQGVAYYYYDGKKESTVGVEDAIANTEEVKASIYTVGGTLFVDGVEAQAVGVYSMSGAMVRMVNNASEVNVEGLNGIYVVVVVDANGVTHTKKIAIR